MKPKDIFAAAIAACLALTMSTHVGADDKTASSTPDADNTLLNTRDRSNESLTSGDQATTPEEITVTAAIRRALMGDDSLTTTAANVKIITTDGTITLRGPVKTDAERAKIAQIAESEARSMKVDNQLEVEPPN